VSLCESVGGQAHQPEALPPWSVTGVPCSAQLLHSMRQASTGSWRTRQSPSNEKPHEKYSHFRIRRDETTCTILTLPLEVSGVPRHGVECILFGALEVVLFFSLGYNIVEDNERRLKDLISVEGMDGALRRRRMQPPCFQK
jgi:hypothetical protein